MTEGTTMTAEREAIVRWLRADVANMRELAKNFLLGGAVEECAAVTRAANQKASIATAIENGDHLKESTHE